MQITSPAFEHNQMIPDKFTCVGANINPALMLEDVPQEIQLVSGMTASVAIRPSRKN